MAYQPGSLGQDTIDPLAYTEDQGGLQPAPQPVPVLPPVPVQPVATPSLVDKGIAFVKDVFTPDPEPSPGDPDYSRPLPRFPGPVTDWEDHPFTQEEIDERAGRPGFFHTVAEELATRRGLFQKIPVFGQMPDATEALRAWQAAQRMKASNYVTPEEEEQDARMLTRYFNEARVRQKMDENRTFFGKAISYPLRSIPFAGEIMLSNALFKRKGLPLQTGQAAMSGTRFGTIQAIKGLNQFIGEQGEKLIVNRMAAYARRYGTDQISPMLKKSTKELTATWLKEAREGLAQNIAGRTLSPEAAFVARNLPHVEVDVAGKLVEKFASVRLASRAIELATHLPIVASGKLLASGPGRQLSRGGFAQDEQGNVTFNDTGETIAESYLKGITQEYLEYLTEFAGGEIGRGVKVLGRGLLPHLHSVKLAELGAKLPGGLTAENRLKAIMGSSTVKRGFKVYGRIMTKLGKEAAVYGPLEEYGEEMLNMVATSVLNLDDDGTPWAARVMKSMLHPVLQPKEAAAMLVGFSLVPVGAFSAGAAMGGLSDTEVRANRDWYRTEVDRWLRNQRPGVLVYQTEEDTRGAAGHIVDAIAQEKLQGDDMAPLARVIQALFPNIQYYRPGSKIELLSRTPVSPMALKSAVKLQNALTTMPREQAVNTIADLLTSYGNAVVVDRLAGDSAEGRKGLEAITGVAATTHRAQQALLQIDPTLTELEREELAMPAVFPSAVEGGYSDEELRAREAQGIMGTREPVQAVINLGEMESAQAKLKALRTTKGLKLSEEQKRTIDTSIADLESGIALARGGGYGEAVAPYVTTIMPDAESHEKAGTGAFALARQITRERLAKPMESLDTADLHTKGHLAEMSPLLDKVLDTTDVYSLPVAGVMRQGGYRFNRGQYRRVNSLFVPGEKGQRDRLYITRLARPADIVHEVTHQIDLEKQQDKKQQSLTQRVAGTLVQFAKGEEILAGRKRGEFPPILEKYLRSHLDEKQNLIEYLTKVEEGQFSDWLAEDVANLMAIYLGQASNKKLPSARFNSDEFEGAKVIASTLNESTDETKPKYYHSLKYALESLIQESPLLKSWHPEALSEQQLKDLRDTVKRTGQEAAAKEAAAKEAAKPVNKPKDKIPKQPAKSVAQPIVTPAVTPVKTADRKVAKTEDKKAAPPKQISAEQLEFEGYKKPRGSLSKLPEAPKEAPPRKALMGLGRVLSVFSYLQTGDPLFIDAGEGVPNWAQLKRRLNELGIAQNRLTPEYRVAFSYLAKHRPQLIGDMLTKPAGDWGLEIDKPVDVDAETGDMDNPYEQFDDGAIVNAMGTQSNVQAFMGILDSTYGAEAVGVGESVLLNLGYRYTGESTGLMDALTAALYSENRFREALAYPEDFLAEYAKDASSEIVDFWKSHLIPALRSFSYQELALPERSGEISLGRVLVSRTVYKHESVNIYRGEMEYRWANANRAARRKVTKKAFTQLRALLKPSKDRSPWEVWTEKNAELAQATLSHKNRNFGAWAKEILAQRDTEKGVPLETYVEVLRVVEAVIGKTEDLGLGITFQDLVDQLDDSTVGQEARKGLIDFLQLLSKNTFEKYTPAKEIGAPDIASKEDTAVNTGVSCHRRAQMALVGDRGLPGKSFTFGVLPIYENALAAKPQHLSTMSQSLGGKRKGIRTGAMLYRRIHQKHTMGFLAENGFITSKTGVVFRRLNDARRIIPGVENEITGLISGEDRTVSVPKEWSATDRRAIKRNELRRAEASAKEKPALWYIISPTGKQTAIDRVRVVFFKDSKELLKKYETMFAWRKSYDATAGVKTVEQFKKQFIDNPTPDTIKAGNWALYDAIFFLMLYGRHENYKGAPDEMKRSGITSGAYVLPHEGFDKVKTVVIKSFGNKRYDGLHILTPTGAKGFQVDPRAGHIKVICDWVDPKFNRILDKGFGLVLSDNIDNLDPVLQAMIKEADALGIHIISIEGDNRKTRLPHEAKAVITQDAEGNLHFDKAALDTSTFEELPPQAYLTVAQLSTSTKPTMEPTVSAQALDSSTLRHQGLIRSILFRTMDAALAKVTPLRGPKEEVAKALAEYFPRDDERNDLLWHHWDAGVQVQYLPWMQFQIRQVMGALFSKLGQNKMFGNRQNTVPDLSKPGKQAIPPAYTDADNNVLTGDALRDAVAKGTTVHLRTADLITNIDGGRYEEAVEIPRKTDDFLADALDYFWENRQKYADLFESDVVDNGESDQYIQLKKEFLVDVKFRLLNAQEKTGDKASWKTMAPGELVLNCRTPNSGFESMTLFRLKRKVGKGDKANISMYDGRIAVNAGEDYDGDWRFTYLVPKNKNGLPRGHAEDLVDEKTDRIQITPYAQGWTDVSGASLAFQVWARGFLHPSESERFLNVDSHPLDRSLDPTVYKAAADRDLKDVQQKAKEYGHNDPDISKQRYEVTGEMLALGNTVRARTTMLHVMENLLALREPLLFRIPGIVQPFRFGGVADISPHQDTVLRAFLGDNIGLSADVLKDLYAISLKLTPNNVNLITAAMVANRSLERVELIPGETEDSPEADLLKSVVGTMMLLRKHLFSEDMVKRLNVSGFLDNKVVTTHSRGKGNRRDKGNLWNDKDLRDLVRFAWSLRQLSRMFDFYRKFEADGVEAWERAGKRFDRIRQDWVDDPDFVFSREVYQTLATQQSRKMVSAFKKSVPELEILQQLNPETKDFAERCEAVYQELAASKEAQEEITKLLTTDLWGYAWAQELLIPDAEYLPKLSPDKTILSDAIDLDTEFEKLPVELQHALVLHDIRKWGLSGDKFKGSYAHLFPPSAAKYALEQLAKLDPELKTALGDQAAAARTPPEASAEVVKVAPSAVTPAAQAPVAQAPVTKEQVDQQVAKVARETGVPAPKSDQKDTPMTLASLSEAHFTYQLAEQLDPISRFHQEMKNKFSFVETLIHDMRLNKFILEQDSGIREHAIPILEALTAFRDFLRTDGSNRDEAMKVRLRRIGDVTKVIRWVGRKDPFKTTHETAGPTVKEVVVEYETFRKANPGLKLKSFDELNKEVQPWFPAYRKLLNAHTQMFVDHGEFLDDLTKRRGTEYVSNKTIDPFPWHHELGRLVREGLDKWFREKHAPGESFEIIIHPEGLEKLVEFRKITDLEAAKSHNLLQDITDPKLREAKINEIIAQIERDAKETSDRYMREKTAHTEYRGFTLDQQFNEFGRILQSPGFGQNMERYIYDTSEVVANKRFLSYLANLTDYSGIPGAFFMQGKDAEARDAQQLISPQNLRNMFNNWRTAMAVKGVQDVPSYNAAKDVWENLKALESIAKTSEWFKQQGYVEVDLTKRLKGFSHVWIMEGDVHRILDHVTSRGFDDWKDEDFEGVLKRIFKGIIWFNEVTKQLALAVSLFHAGSLSEAYIAGYGITKRNPLFNLKQFGTDVKQMWKLGHTLLKDPAQRKMLNQWMAANLTFRFSDKEPLAMDPKGEGGALDNAMQAIIKYTEKYPVVSPIRYGVLAIQKAKLWGDHVLWEVMQPAMKVMTAERLFNEVSNDPQYAGLMSTEADELKLRQEIAQVVNQTFGGINWHEMVWATPMARNILRMTWFAPDWTASNLQMAGVPDIFEKTLGIHVPLGPSASTGIRRQFQTETYWPSYIMLTLLLVPTAWQYAIYAAFGNPDDGDEPFMWMNEDDKRSHIDITPLTRRLGKKFGITEKRRAYMRWGKSGYEIGGWFENPWRSFLGKSSMGVKTAIEQFFNKNSAGWDMPWADKDASVPMAGILMVDGKFSESRLAYILQKFAPMTILNFAKGDRPPAFFAPSSLGMSQYKAQKIIAEVLQAYGDENVWYQLKGKPAYVKRLTTLVDSTLEAAWQNGYDPREVMSRAKSLAHGRQATEFFAELEKRPKDPNVAKLEKIARSAQRTDTAFRSMNAGVKRRYEKRGRVITDKQREAMGAAWQAALEKREEERK